MEERIDESPGMKVAVRRVVFRRFAWYGWPAGLTIIVIAALVEVVPLILGIAENAIVNWSFFYVTFRFILLPVVCGLHIVVNAVFFLTRRSRRVSARLVDLSSVLLSAGYLILCFFYPLPFSKPFL